MKSFIGFCIFLRDSLVFWKAKKKSTISYSFVETDNRALAVTTGEIVWIEQLLHDFGKSALIPALLFCGNQPAIHIASNPFFHGTTKHIEINYHFVPDKVNGGFIKLMPIRSQYQLADVFNKHFIVAMLFPLLSKMALKDIHSPS